MPAPAWVAIQESTFTRWVHVQLGTDADGDGDVDAGKANLGLADVFKTGTNLIKILEKVTGKGIGRKYKENPKLKLQQLENLNIAFNFMENEGVKLVNITGEDIWNGSLKLILGMIWTIIYQFQVSRMDIDGKKNPKEALLEWIQSKIPDFNITNLNGDWRDGRAVCGLTQALGKELYDGEDVIASIGSSEQALENAKTGIDTAHAKLGVPKLLTPEIITSKDCDEHSMVAYLSQFRDALRAEAPVQAKAKVFIPVTVVTAAAPEPELEPEPEPEPEPAQVSTAVPPLERAPDWRTYEGHDLGGRCRIRVYFSTTTSSLMIRKNTEALQKLLEAKKVHLRPDFEPWIPIDMDMEKPHRDKIFEKAGQRETPMLFVDDEFKGGFEKVMELNEMGELQRILDY